MSEEKEKAAEEPKAPSKIKSFFVALGGGMKGVAKSTGSRATGVLKGILSAPFLIFQGDWIQRILVVGFVASVVLAWYSGREILRSLAKKLPKSSVSVSKGSLEEEKRKNFLSQQKDLAKLAANVFQIGRFTSSLRSKIGNVTSFEFELYVESDSPETTMVLKDNITAIRDAIDAAIQGHSYEELIEENGKPLLQKAILGAINKTLHDRGASGAVKSVYFSRFVMG